MRQRERKPCPKCRRSDSVVPIVYGYPTPELERAAKRGEVDHWGCMIGGLDPLLACRRCRIRFEFARPELADAETARRGWIEDGESSEVVQAQEILDGSD